MPTDARLALKHLRVNESTHCHDEVAEGTDYAHWYIVEHTGAGWFPWPGMHLTKARAQTELDKITLSERKD